MPLQSEFETPQDIDAMKANPRRQSIVSMLGEHQDNNNSSLQISTETPERRHESIETSKSHTYAQNRTYPADCYSFMAIHSPLESPLLFGFGFLVWAFQIAFLILFVLRVASPRLSTNEDTDNPDDGFFAQFIPSNVGHLSRATQFMALLAYCIFADESVKDMATAVETWPRPSKAGPHDRVGLLMLSSALRLTQGVLATIAVILLVFNTSDVIDIILNFSAVNFISAFDDLAFELAQWGKYGPRLEAEANRIEDLPAPPCMVRKYQHIRYRYTILPIFAILLLSFATMASRQDSTNYWLTKRFRVEFLDADYGMYGGCYDVTNEISKWQRFVTKREVYKGLEYNRINAKFAYCHKDRQWWFFKGNETNACNVLPEDQLAYSDRTYDFDISSAFEGGWFRPIGLPLPIFTLTDPSDLDETRCSSFFGDGHCDAVLNYEEVFFDGGDCCAATCTSERCGKGSLSNAFGTNLTIVGDGHSRCKDPTMKPITILLNDIFVPEAMGLPLDATISKSELELAQQIIFADGNTHPRNPIMTIDCDDKNILWTAISPEMRNQSETIMVSDGASCTMTVRNSTLHIQKAFAQVWYVNYTIYHGDSDSIFDDSIIMAEGSSLVEETLHFQRIEDCFLDKLGGLLDKSTIYTGTDPSNQAIEWLMHDPSEFSKCEDEHFVERYALAAINFAAPFQTNDDDESSALWIEPKRHCIWDPVECNQGSVVELNFEPSGLKMSGTLASEIGLLSQLLALDVKNHDLHGLVPSEIGRLQNLKLLIVRSNNLEGSLPTELGLLQDLIWLDLSDNRHGPGSGLRGSIPGEFTKMKSLEVALLDTNAITGMIPSDIHSLSRLKILSLVDNSLSGTIPSRIGKIQNLFYFGIAQNYVTGTIPSELGLLINSTFDMDFNLLTGNIPLEILENQSIRSVKIYANELSNLIPVVGSEICISDTISSDDDDAALVTPSNETQIVVKGSLGGEHYCNCKDECFASSEGPNLCACSDARSCCDAFLSELQECEICEFGLQNPNFYMEPFGFTCAAGAALVKENLRDFGTREQCSKIRKQALEIGCRCFEGSNKDND